MGRAAGAGPRAVPRPRGGAAVRAVRGSATRSAETLHRVRRLLLLALALVLSGPALVGAASASALTAGEAATGQRVTAPPRSGAPHTASPYAGPARGASVHGPSSAPLAPSAHQQAPAVRTDAPVRQQRVSVAPATGEPSPVRSDGAGPPGVRSGPAEAFEVWDEESTHRAADPPQGRDGPLDGTDVQGRTGRRCHAGSASPAAPGGRFASSAERAGHPAATGPVVLVRGRVPVVARSGSTPLSLGVQRC